MDSSVGAGRLPDLVRCLLVVVLTGWAADSAAQLDRCDGDTVSARGKSQFNGEVTFDALLIDGEYRLVDCNRRIFTLDMHEGIDLSEARHFSSKAAVFNKKTHAAAVSVHWAAQRFYDFLQENFDWQGYSNDGEALYQYVHYGKDYFNAVFDEGVVIYGDGGAYNSNPIVSVDYVGHEVSHGITLRSAGLIYFGESGALNESFSDIFAKVFEHSLLPERSDVWEMFPDIYRDRGMSTRSMSQPQTAQVPRDDTAEKVLRRRAAQGLKTVYKGSAREYLGPAWSRYKDGGGDFYINAGPHNHWFYLLVEGGRGVNFLGHNYKITGIGLQAAAQIAWRNLTVYLRPDSDYMDARYGSEQSALDLFGAESQEYASVRAAWDAVAVTEANYQRLPRPDRNIIELSMVDAHAEESIRYDVSANIEIAFQQELPTVDPVTRDDVWWLQSNSKIHNYRQLIAWQNWQQAGGRSYEIRFTEAGGKALFEDDRGERGVRRVPFEVWELGESLDSPHDDTRYVPIVFDIDKDGEFGLFEKDKTGSGYTVDHPAGSGESDRWTDMLHIAAPVDTEAGDNGYQRFVKHGLEHIGARHLMWLAFVRPEQAAGSATTPATGKSFRIVLSRAMEKRQRPQAVQ